MFLKSCFCDGCLRTHFIKCRVDRFHMQGRNITNLDLIPERPVTAVQPRKVA